MSNLRKAHVALSNLGVQGHNAMCRRCLKLGALDGGVPNVVCYFKEMAMSPVAIFEYFLVVLLECDIACRI